MLDEIDHIDDISYILGEALRVTSGDYDAKTRNEKKKKKNLRILATSFVKL